MKNYTSKEILDLEDLYELQDTYSSSGIVFSYQLTDGEFGWMDFIKNKYGIYDLLIENIDEKNILTFCFDSYELGQVLEDDSVHYKAVCLSEDSALQKLFFWLSSEPEMSED
tara:strand:- start:358 stop:693 length:336 start_codon:yes stop_codon:yes gene_type:complete